MTGVELYAPRSDRHRRTWTLATIPLVIAFVFVGALCAVGLETVLKAVGSFPDQKWARFAIVFSGAFGFCAVALMLWVLLFERRGLATIGLAGIPGWSFLRGLLWGGVSLAAVVCTIALAGGYRIEAGGSWTQMSWMALAPFGAAALAFLVQGSTEELLIRGWLMQLTASRHGVTAGIVFSTIVFSLLHGINIKPSDELVLGLANIVLVGAFLGLYAAQEGSIWGVCGWHAAWNWLLGVGFGLEVSGGEIGAGALVVDLKSDSGVPWWITGGAFGPEASLVTTGVLLAGFLWLLFRGPRVT